MDKFADQELYDLYLAENIVLNNLTTDEYNMVDEILNQESDRKIEFLDKIEYFKSFHQTIIRSKFKNQLELFLSDKKKTTKKASLTPKWTKLKPIFNISTLAASLLALVLLSQFYLYTLLDKTNNNEELIKLSKDIEFIKKNQWSNNSLPVTTSEKVSKIPKTTTSISTGTGIMIDPKGYILTNAHILKGKQAIVINANKKEFRANVILKIDSIDLVILKIDDTDYISQKTPFPITIRPIKVKLGEDVFALSNVFGKDLVFAKGYIGCTSGFNNDTNYYQIDMSAFPGNSGSPVFDKNGSIVGLLSYKQKSIESISYSLKNRQIFHIIKELQNRLKSDNNNFSDLPQLKIQLPKNGAFKPELTKQISILEPYIFAVKAY